MSFAVELGRSGNSQPVFRLTSASLTTRPSTDLSTMERTGNEITQEESDVDEPQVPNLEFEVQVRTGTRKPNAVVKEELESSNQKPTESSGSKKANNHMDEYEVEEILEKRKNKKTKKPEYFVKWLGWPMEDNTWEPLENLRTVKYMVDEFNAKHDPPKVNKKRPRSSPPAKKRETVDGEPARKTHKTSSTASAPRRHSLRSAVPLDVDEDLHDSLVGDEGPRRTKSRAASVASVGRYAELSDEDDEVKKPPRKSPKKKMPKPNTGAGSTQDDLPVTSDEVPPRSKRAAYAHDADHFAEETEDSRESPILKPKSSIVKIKIGPKSKIEARKRMLKELEEKEAALQAQQKTQEENTPMPSTSQIWKRYPVIPGSTKQDAQEEPTGPTSANDDQASETSFRSAASTSAAVQSKNPEPPNATNLLKEVLYAREHGETWQYLVELQDFSRKYVDAEIILQDYPKLGLAFWEKWMKSKIKEGMKHLETSEN